MGGLGNRDIMAKNIQYYMELNEKSRSDMCRDLKISYSTFADWVNGNTYPRIDKIELMANYFGVQKSDLVEEKTMNLSENGNENYYINEDARMLLQDYNNRSDLKVLFDASRKLTVKDVQFIIDMVERMKD